MYAVSPSCPYISEIAASLESLVISVEWAYQHADVLVNNIPSHLPSIHPAKHPLVHELMPSVTRKDIVWDIFPVIFSDQPNLDSL